MHCCKTAECEHTHYRGKLYADRSSTGTASWKSFAQPGQALRHDQPATQDVHRAGAPALPGREGTRQRNQCSEGASRRQLQPGPLRRGLGRGRAERCRDQLIRGNIPERLGYTFANLREGVAYFF